MSNHHCGHRFPKPTCTTNCNCTTPTGKQGHCNHCKATCNCPQPEPPSERWLSQ